MFLTLCIWPHRRAPPCAASQWGPGQGRPAAHLPPHSPFRHSLLHWFYARHLRGIYIRHQPASSQCASCSSSKAAVEVVVVGVAEVGGAAGLCLDVGLCSRVELTGWWVGWGELTADPTLWAASWLRWWMVRGLPLLHLVVQSRPTREDAGRKSEDQERGAFTGKSFIINCLPFVFCFPGYSPSVKQIEYVQHIGSQTQLGSGIPMVPVWAEQRGNAHEWMVKAFSLHLFKTII